MRIVRLSSENVKRLEALTIEVDGLPVVVVGGWNEAGKSSALDSVAYALGGASLAPERPIRDGQTEAKIVVDLEGGLRVERRFSRDRLQCNCQGPAKAGEPFERAEDREHATGCASRLFGPVRSTLKVTAADGARYPSPQAMLDSMLGSLSFDPLEFAKMKPKEQREILAKIAGLDLDAMTKARTELAGKALEAKRDLRAAESALAGMANVPDDAPMEETPAADIVEAIRAAQALAEKAREAESAIEAAVRVRDLRIDSIRAREQDILGRERELEELKAELEKRGRELSDAIASGAEAEALVRGAQRIAVEVRASVPDLSSLQASLAGIEKANAAARDRKERDRRALLAVAAEDALSLAQEALDVHDARSKLAIETAKLPVEGLSLTEDGVLWKGAPFAQAAQSGRIRASMAIGLALNPTIKVVLARDGSLLDPASRALVAEMAEAANAQVWMEVVTGDAEGCTVLLEEGHIKA